MIKNENSVDRIIRVVIGLILLVAGYYTSGVLSIVLYILGAVALVTGATGFCGLYKLFNLSTIKK
jgi:uncharacterized membrane protein